MTRLSEHIMKVTDVLCLSAVTIRGHEWLDVQGLDVRPGRYLGQKANAWHAFELQEARQALEGAPQPCSARGQHAPAVHQAVLADGQARSQRRPLREHRRDLKTLLHHAALFNAKPSCWWRTFNFIVYMRVIHGSLVGGGREAKRVPKRSSTSNSAEASWLKKDKNGNNFDKTAATLWYVHRETHSTIVAFARFQTALAAGTLIAVPPPSDLPCKV